MPVIRFIRQIVRQREAGADTHFEYAAAGHAIGELDGTAAADRGYAAEYEIIDPGPSLVGGANVIGIQGGPRSRAAACGLLGMAHCCRVPSSHCLNAAGEPRKPGSVVKARLSSRKPGAMW